LLETQGQADWKRYAGELYEDPAMRRIGRFPLLVLLPLLLPTVAGFVLHGFTLGGALRGYVWGALVRIFLVHHVTWSVNSICHFFGRRRFDIEDHSTNVAWLSGAHARRVLAPQPPRISPLRLPRPPVVGDRSFRAHHLCTCARRPRLGGSQDHSRTPTTEGTPGRAACACAMNEEFLGQ
jgi:hypothetical protein